MQKKEKYKHEKETGAELVSLVSKRISFMFPEKLDLEASAFNRRDEGGQGETILRILTNSICISDYYNQAMNIPAHSRHHSSGFCLVLSSCLSDLN